MTIDPTQTGMSLANAAQVATTNRMTAENEPEDSVFLEIIEKGFVAYVEEMQKEKIEEMRKEILDRMGLTEETLAALPSETRSAIEDAISAEIRRRLTAQTEVNAEETGTEVSASSIGSTDPTIAGGALLLMLQEAGDRRGLVTDSEDAPTR